MKKETTAAATSAPSAPAKPTHQIGGSVLASSDPSILQPMVGAHGTFQVRPCPELDTYCLFFEKSELAMHPNGYSCHNLAKRILEVWEGKREVQYAMEQFDYILACGGMGRQRATAEFIVRGLPKDE